MAADEDAPPVASPTDDKKPLSATTTTSSHDDAVTDSADTSPLLQAFDSPTMSRASSMSTPTDFTLEEDPFSGLTLIDLLVQLDAKVDLLSRRIQQKLPAITTRLPEWKIRAQESFAKRSKLTGTDRVEREVTRFRLKVSDRLKKLDSRWNEAKTVTIREKASFVVGVMNVLLTGLAIGLKPHWIPMIYTLQACYFLPLRIYSYRKLAYHYFLFDLCYFVNVLCLAYIWVFPGSDILFEACYTLSHGPLATAIATWRNSLVFHSIDKVTSFFIHIFPCLTVMMIRHSIPHAEKDYPALTKLPTLHLWRSLAVSTSIYLFWQIAYYRFVIIARRDKIKSGRVTSFTYLLNDKKGAIGKILHKIPEGKREVSFMAAQLVYTIVTVLPAILLFYDHGLSNAIYLIACFAIATNNGAGYYMEVFGRRFEKELHKLQRELEDLQQEYQRAAETGRFPLSRTNSQHHKAAAEGEVEDGEGAALTRSQSAPSGMEESSGQASGEAAGGEGAEKVEAQAEAEVAKDLTIAPAA